MSQTEVPTDDVGQRRRYRWLFGFEWILLVLTIAGFTLIRKVPADWPRIALGYVLVFLCMWHIVVIPICFFYLIGNPIVIVSPSRKFRKQLKQRPKLNDDEFYARFYEGSGIPKEIPTRVRRCLSDIYSMVDRVIPTDLVWQLEDELDYEGVLFRIGNEFGIHFTKADYPSVDGTLGNLILMVHVRISPQFG